MAGGGACARGDEAEHLEPSCVCVRGVRAFDVWRVVVRASCLCAAPSSSETRGRGAAPF